MPALGKVRNAFTISYRDPNPAFSGVNGQIQMGSQSAFYGGMGTKSGQKLDEKGALRVAAIWIAVTILADEVASLTLKIVKKDDVTRTLQQPPALRALWSDEPNVDQTRFGIDASETLSMVLWGYSATMLGWTRANELDVRWPIDPAGIRLERTDRGGLRLKSTAQGDLVNEPGDRPQFSFIPLYTLPGVLMPVSPVRMAAELAGLGLAYEETAARLMGRGMNPSALLTADTNIDPAQAAELSSRLEQLYGGSANSGKIAVAGGKGLKLERMTMSMADAQFIEQNDHVFNMLMAMWRVPQTVAGMVDKPSTWGTGVAEFSRGLERFTLRPLVERRQAAHQKYITKWVDETLQVRYSFDSLLSASAKERTEIQRAQLFSGLTSEERVLAQNDEPPFRPEETVYSQLAMAQQEDRDLARLKSRAETYKTLVFAGVEPDAAAEASGFDPKQLKSVGVLPKTLQLDPAMNPDTPPAGGA